MIYRVILDGNDILNFQEREYVLLNPMINMELNTAGSFEFSMPPSHAFYDSINPIISTIEVYEDESLLWFGRPMEMKKDFFNNRQISQSARADEYFCCHIADLIDKTAVACCNQN